ncbi:MAG: ABC transporter permease [Saprospiraceae bacterium]|nr:ABC transporter permease [Saprospiraceae bacterium]
MIYNNLKIAFRSLLKNRMFSLINIAGLAIGTLSCLYILLYVHEQYSYDKHHLQGENIYRITTALTLPGDKHINASSSPPIAPALKNDFAEVEQFTRVIPSLGVSQYIIHYNEKSLTEKSVFFVDSTFFDVFNYHFIYGKADRALSEPYSLVLSKTLADKIFENEDPVGKHIELVYSYGKDNYTVQGVFDNSLGKSHINANIFITMNGGGMGNYARNNDSWAGNNFAYSYIKLKPGSKDSELESKLPAFLNKYGQEQLKALGMQKQLHLQSVSSIHTTRGFEVEMDKIANPIFLNILLLIAALIMLIACINFMNLSTASSSVRAKEVGVRKVVGADRFQLIKQFLTESMLLSFLGVMVALPVLWLTLPYLNQISNSDISLTFISDFRLWLILAALIIFTGFIAGIYPAFYLSAFKSISVLKGNFTSHISTGGIRKILVVFQFVLSVILISGIIVIYSQLNYIKKKDIGFDTNQKLIFTFHTDDTRKKSKAFADDLRQQPEIIAVSRANNYLSQPILNDWTFYTPGGDMTTGQIAQFMITDQFFVQANGIKILSGRDFRLNDSGRVLINETMAHKMRLDPEKAIGTNIYSKQINQEPESFEIAGIMKDFNFNSLHQNVKPILLRFNDNDPYLSNVIVSVNSADYKSLLKKVEGIWKKNVPEAPFEYSFLDDEVQKQYESEVTLSNIINVFTAIAIFISCLGLFGLATFSTEKRRKEIGIRKVLGASVSGIISLLSSDFIKLVALAFIIATPIAWWLMDKWLQAFAFRVPVSWWMFAIAGLIAILIAVLSVGSQAIKAAISNPIKSLRTE